MNTNQVVSSNPLPDTNLRGAYASANVKLSLRNGAIYVAFSYDAKLVAIMRTFPGRKVYIFSLWRLIIITIQYHQEAKSWSIPLAGLQAAILVFEFLGIKVADSVSLVCHTTYIDFD